MGREGEITFPFFSLNHIKRRETDIMIEPSLYGLRREMDDFLPNVRDINHRYIVSRWDIGFYQSPLHSRNINYKYIVTKGTVAGDFLLM